MNSDFRNEDTVYFTSSDSATGDGIDQDTNKLISTMKQFCAANSSNATCSCFDTAMSYLSNYNSKYKDWKDTTDALQADYDARTDIYNKAYSSKKIDLDNYIINKSTWTHWGGMGQSPSESPPIECTNNNIYKCTSTNHGQGPNTTQYDWVITYSDQYKQNILDSIPKIAPVPDPSLTKPDFNPKLSCCNNSITGGVNTVFTNIQQSCNIGGGDGTDKSNTGTDKSNTGTSNSDTSNSGTSNSGTSNNRTIIIFGVVCGAVILICLLLWVLSWHR